MKMYNYYRLVIIKNDGTLLTGDAMKAYLISIGFEVEYEEFDKGVRPTAPTTPPGSPEWIVYKQELITYDIFYRQSLVTYLAQFDAYAIELDIVFTMARLVTDGRNPNGTNKFKYVVDVPMNYTMLQAAQKLLLTYGKPGMDAAAIDFIANGKFG